MSAANERRCIGPDFLDPVEGEHEMRTGLYGRAPSTPGVTAGLRVHDMDLMLPDEAGEALGIASEHEKILRIQRKLESSCARPQQVIRKRTPRRGNERAPARFHHRAGDVDRAAHAAAWAKARQHLQHARYGAFRHRCQDVRNQPTPGTVRV